MNRVIVDVWCDLVIGGQTYRSMRKHIKIRDSHVPEENVDGNGRWTKREALHARPSVDLSRRGSQYRDTSTRLCKRIWQLRAKIRTSSYPPSVYQHNIIANITDNANTTEIKMFFPISSFYIQWIRFPSFACSLEYLLINQKKELRNLLM